MVSAADLQGWQAMLDRMRRGPAPRGEQVELCREVLAAAPHTPEGLEAARLLLEGAMADAATSIADAQAVMRLLKAVGRGEVELGQLITPP